MPFLLNGRQTTAVSNARGVWNGFAQHTHYSAPGHELQHAEVRVLSQSPFCIRPGGNSRTARACHFFDYNR